MCYDKIKGIFPVISKRKFWYQFVATRDLMSVHASHHMLCIFESFYFSLVNLHSATIPLYACSSTHGARLLPYSNIQHSNATKEQNLPQFLKVESKLKVAKRSLVHWIMMDCKWFQLIFLEYQNLIKSSH